ncbi:hypothetical protein CEXT_671771 [Caerostris extrusa]|uniref:Uncharacterized protein n=1 Tax=Caerostris extrusa TaxID=172846 RepID=A0AAV4XJE8_CAEEX|nr:hypothetical protein CEXT_671771 [Caerostris extrusa]
MASRDPSRDLIRIIKPPPPLQFEPTTGSVIYQRRGHGLLAIRPPEHWKPRTLHQATSFHVVSKGVTKRNINKDGRTEMLCIKHSQKLSLPHTHTRRHT